MFALLPTAAQIRELQTAQANAAEVCMRIEGLAHCTCLLESCFTSPPPPLYHSLIAAILPQAERARIAEAAIQRQKDQNGARFSAADFDELLNEVDNVVRTIVNSRLALFAIRSGSLSEPNFPSCFESSRCFRAPTAGWWCIATSKRAARCGRAKTTRTRRGPTCCA